VRGDSFSYRFIILLDTKRASCRRAHVESCRTTHFQDIHPVLLASDQLGFVGNALKDRKCESFTTVLIPCFLQESIAVSVILKLCNVS